MMGLPGLSNSLTISLAIWIQSTNVTDGRTDTGRQQRPRLRIASRGTKNCFIQRIWKSLMTVYCTLTIHCLVNWF